MGSTQTRMFLLEITYIEMKYSSFYMVILTMKFKGDFIKSITLCNQSIGHFTVVCLVTWPLSGSEAGGDLVLIQTLLLFTCKSCCSHAN